MTPKFKKDRPDEKWAKEFVGCEIEGTGRRFNETVAVLVKKLREVRLEAEIKTYRNLRLNVSSSLVTRREWIDYFLGIERASEFDLEAAIQEGKKP